MSILITGGVSKLSVKLTEILLGQGHQVIFLHNNSAAIPSSLLSNPSLKLANLSSIHEDAIRTLIDEEKVQKVFDVSLLTSDVHLPPLQGAKTLILGITSVLDAIRTSSTPPSLTVVSGEEVYGRSALRDETQPLAPVSFAGAAQMSVEAMVHSYGVSYRIPIVIGRVPSVLAESKEDLAGKLGELANDTYQNFLSLTDAANGIIGISTLADGQKPAEVFNISNSFDVLAGNPAESRSSSLSNQKILKSGVWAPSSLDGLEENLSGATSSSENIQPIFLIYGDAGNARAQFLELAKLEGLDVMESTISNFEEATDKSVWEEVNSTRPSHLIYFSNESEPFEGDCFTLRTNMATNLYFPWLLASVAERTAIHFTHFGNPADAQTTSAEAVKGHADKMLSYFENTLRLGQSVDKNALELIKSRKTGALNNNA